MKRDWALMRKIMLAIEANDDPGVYSYEIKIDGYSQKDIAFQLMTLDKAGFIEGEEGVGTDDGLYWNARNLTHEGFDLLDSIRSDTVWKKVMASVAKVGGSVTTELLVAIAKTTFAALVKSKLPALDLE